ncbi:hypothetical protein ICV32_08735 [Polynucleobacter sp. MWH-UH24A]|uniref:hypothetical protein n=1 Tax=Polynucleobacter sp. MWH-UH24A TaxID=2689110 RepID=UPI001BFEBC49|nr:hypothetical protein [Polynucleobacter sp. MWH-UH24A]QWD75887.1 hypothetical protein ICV32_08735 [Polynucleobacter sp. MWH-UH24A]
MRLLLFCEQTGARLDPKQSAAVCAAAHHCKSLTNCPLIPKPQETNHKASSFQPINTSS